MNEADLEKKEVVLEGKHHLIQKAIKHLGMYEENINDKQNIKTPAVKGCLGLYEVLKETSSKANELIKIKSYNFNFSDDIWDASDRWMPGTEISNYRINFKLKAKTQVPEFIDFLKMYSIHNMYYFNNRTTTWIGMTKHAKTIFNKLANNGVDSIQSITIDDVKRLDNGNPTDFYDKKCKIRDIFDFYNLITGEEIDKDLYSFLLTNNLTELNKIAEKNKTKLISKKYHNAIVHVLRNTFEDKTEDIYVRGVAGLELIMTQTGIRSNEIRILRHEDLIILSRGKINAAYLNYRGTKSTTEDGEYTNASIVANETVVKTFNKLKSFKYERLNTNNYLVPGYNDEPLTESTFNSILDRIWNKNIEYLKENNNDEFKKPTYKEFRVYVSTEFENRGVSQTMIRKMFGQKAKAMDGYYSRSSHPIQENILFTRKILKEIIEDDLTILGSKGKLDNRVLNKLVERNCMKTIDEVIDVAAGVLPIRSTNGGFCMKLHPAKKCEVETEIDPIYCAYGVCPNRVHLYFHIGANFKKAQDMFESLKYDLELDEGNDPRNETQKQAYILNNLLKQIIEPELDELDKEINKQGAEKIISKHPELDYVINNRSEFNKQIKEMKEKINEVIK